MRQAYISYTETYEDEDDTPLEGKKSCMAEAYTDAVFHVSEDEHTEAKLLN